MDEDLAIIRQTGGTRGPRRAAWGRVLERWQQSGLGAREFCRQYGIRVKSFCYWQTKLQQQAAPAGGAFTELELLPGRPSLLPGGPSIEIHLGLARVMLPFDGDARRLAMVLQAVREAAC